MAETTLSPTRTAPGTAVAGIGDIARGFARLPADKRRAFLDALRARGIAFSRLPVVPLGMAGESGEAVAASPAQRRLWTLARLNPDSAAYGMPGLYRLNGPLDPHALDAALAVVAERHAVLRGVYREEENGALTMEPRPAGSLRIDRHDLRHLPSTDREAEADALAERLVAEPWDLTRVPPIRVGLLRMGMEEHRLVVTIHHIAADGASIPLFIAELAEAYRALRRSEPPRLPDLPVQYADIAAWQAAWMEAGEAGRQTAFWRATLGGAPALLDLPTDRPRAAAGAGDAGAEQATVLDRRQADALRALARTEGCTLFALLAAAYALLLGRLAGQEDVVIGCPVAGRRQPEAERLIGCFVNTLPLRLRIEPERPFRDWLAGTGRRMAEAQDHQDLPFEAIAEALKAERGANPLIQASFDHSTAPPRFDRLDDLTVVPLELPVRTAKFDLALATAEQADGSILVRLAHRTALFDAGTATRIQRRWLRLLEQIAAHPDHPLHRLDPRDDAERAAIAGWSHGAAWKDTAFPHAATPLPQRLAQVAAARPEAPAVLFGDTVLSHGELNRRANRLARRLLHLLEALGAGPEARIGVSLPRTPDLLVALLGVMKSGAAFVPLDPAYPPERRRAIREAAGLSLLIALEPLDDLPVLAPTDTAGMPDDEPATAIHPRSLAYIIHTSGSTGQPKGVAVEHGPLAMHCAATGALYDMDADSRELHFLSFTFDGAHERWMTALSHGGSILLRDDSLWTAEQTYDAIRRHRVTHAGFPPKYLQQLAAWAEAEGARGVEPPPVQLYSFGGEAMPRKGLERLFRSLRPRTAINGYGPTETVVTPLVWKGDGTSVPDCAYVPIGRPVGDRSAHILDGHLNPVPIGVTGELWIGGGGLARGYVGQPAATAERFIPDPHGAAPGARLYRTGDLARWREDGTVEFLGRRDHQVKLRGFRIELGEIEARLSAHPEIREAVVVAQESEAVTRLVGYLVPVAGRRPDPAMVTAWLVRTLPAHMVPARLMVLDAMPVTPTGKLDRAALPQPVWEAAGTVAPRTPAEALLAGIWETVLAAGRIGVTDNFFEIGGDSILALQIVARARQAGLHLTPRQIFERQTVEALAAVAEPAADGAVPIAEAAPGPVPLTPIQAWFLDQPVPGRDRWNQSVLLATAGPVERPALERALAAVAARHDALRLRFNRGEDGRWIQTLPDGTAFDPLALIPLDEAEAADDAAVTRLCDAAQGQLDLAHGPLMRALLIRRTAETGADGGQRLFLVAHHLAVDGVSWRVLLEDLRAVAFGPCGVTDGDPGAALPPRTTPFADWARRLAGLASDPRFLAEAAHWRAALDAPTLPPDRPGGANTRGLAATRSLRLSMVETRALLTVAPAAYRTRIDALLLTALARTVAERWSLPALTVHLEGHGREDLLVPAADLSRTVGWFTSVYPVRLAPPHQDWDAAIRHVKEALAAVPNGGIGFNLLRHLGPPELRADLDRGTPALSFNYLGQFDGLTADGPWRAAGEDCGAGTDPQAPLGALLSFDGQVSGGALTFHARFSTALFDEATIDALMAAYRTALLALIAHCASVEPGQATPSDFPLAGLTQARLDRLPLPAPAIADIFPPTPMQAAMLRHALHAPASDAYRVQIWATVDGVDIDRLAGAWRTVVARHEILRACADGLEGPAPLLVVARAADLPIELLDWRSLPDPDAAWSALLDRDHRQGFDAGRAPLMRIALARTGPTTVRLLWSWHHALLDGWSMSRLLGEVLRLYEGEAPPLPGRRARDFVAWSRTQDNATSEALWRERLGGLPGPTLLTRVIPPPDAPEPDGAATRRFDAPAVARLQAFAGARKVTLNTLVQAGWLRVLGQATGQRRVAFGATMSGRSGALPGIDGIVGLLVATLPVVRDAEPDAGPDGGTGAWLRGLLAENLTLRQHEHAPPPALQCWTGDDDAPFDSVLVFENYPVDDALRGRAGEGPGDALSFREVGNRGRTSYPLTIIAVPQEMLTLRLDYDGSRFARPAVEALADALVAAILDIAGETRNG